MILKKDMLTKSLRKGRTGAVELLNQIAQVGGIPHPHYEYEAGGSTKKRSHFYKVVFRVPEFIREEKPFSPNTVVGAGRCSTKSFAKSLAALEAVHRLERELNFPVGGLKKRMDDLEEKQLKRQQEVETTPVEAQIEGVSWKCAPLDPAFSGTNNRLGRIQFFPSLILNSEAFIAAKALTLCAKKSLPKIEHHANQTDNYGEVQRFANIIPNSGHDHVITGCQGELARRIKDKPTAEIRTLERAYRRFEHWNWKENTPTSFGMAKLFTGLPQHQFKELRTLLQQVKDKESNANSGNQSNSRFQRRKNQKRQPSVIEPLIEDVQQLKSRIRSFAKHKEKCSLPVDSVQDKIPHDATVTIIQGGTGSGKTTRYPLMLSLFSPTGPRTKVLVAQPRRLACQTAARRVAFEQDVELGSPNCPIGYAIRFEAVQSTSGQRTVDFQTPGIILRRAMEDPLLQDVTHLVLDEIHERNADMDLLVALAKTAQRQRAINDPSNPLRVILMSATLDSSQWEAYFNSNQGNDDKNNIRNSIAVVDVPCARRFPIEVVHLGEKGFPSKNLEYVQQLLNGRGRHDTFDDAYDDALCKATAQLSIWLVEDGGLANGSILCFLPGIEEIRQCDQLIRQLSNKKRNLPLVRYLHSSLSSKEQARAFETYHGPKIILSTNIAETSVTIPDVKVIIDSGRERQFSMLDDSSVAFDGMSVVGSQLATVNISQASAMQRAGRSGRVSAGTCYRLYSRQEFDGKFVKFTKPEMLRMDLSQLILHSLSMYHPNFSHPLALLLDTPDPPSPIRVQQTIRSLEMQGLVECHGKKTDTVIALTSLGHVVTLLPASPQIGRMLFMGLVVRAIDPALQIAGLLSVPNVFATLSNQSKQDESRDHTSDVVMMLETYQKFLANNGGPKNARTALEKHFSQAHRVEQQLKHALVGILKQQNKNVDSKERVEIEWSSWNANEGRVAALAALVCNATPHIAHLVNGQTSFATRDIAGSARIHPSSVNARPKNRSHWYLYKELRTTSAPYLHVTTAASPLELALFAEATSLDENDDCVDYRRFLEQKDWLFLADQWVPVALAGRNQANSFVTLRRLLSHDMLQEAANDATSVVTNPLYTRIILYVFAAIEQHRLNK